MTYFRVRNFSKFQHYKTHLGPMRWIKLYTSLIDDYDFAKLPDAQKYATIGLFLIAGMTRNKIPNDPEYLRVTLHMSEPIDLKALKKFGFVEALENG